MKTKFEAYKDTVGELRWRATRGQNSANGGEGYKRMAGLRKAMKGLIESIRSGEFKCANDKDSPGSGTCDLCCKSGGCPFSL